MPRFTVVGLHEDNGQPWVAHVEAENGGDALVVALREFDEDADVTAVEAFEGHVCGVSGLDAVLTRGEA